MMYRNLGSTGVKVSRLCLGSMMFGDPTPEEDSIHIIHAALDAGINFVDTADKYAMGESERIVGKALKGKREQVVLATKVGLAMGTGPNDVGLSRKHIRAAAEASLKRLDTDYLDLYYLHVPDATTPLEESLGAMEDLVRAGMILYAGCSNFWGWQIARGIGLQEQAGWDRLAACQPLYNIANRDAELEVIPACAALGLGVVPYSPLARGVLTGKYAAGEAPPEGSRAARGNERLMQTEFREANFELAQRFCALAQEVGCPPSQLGLAWVVANPLITATIIGPRTMAQLTDNLGALHLEVTPEIEAQVDALVPPGEHSGRGFRDPLYPVAGRPVGK